MSTIYRDAWKEAMGRILPPKRCVKIGRVRLRRTLDRSSHGSTESRPTVLRYRRSFGGLAKVMKRTILNRIRAGGGQIAAVKINPRTGSLRHRFMPEAGVRNPRNGLFGHFCAGTSCHSIHSNRITPENFSDFPRISRGWVWGGWPSGGRK